MLSCHRNRQVISKGISFFAKRRNKFVRIYNTFHQMFSGEPSSPRGLDADTQAAGWQILKQDNNR